jgi:two-component system sensor histidine kinase MtrB
VFRSFRTRLAVTIVLLVGVTVVLVGILSYALVERSLRNQLAIDAVEQAEFNIGVLASSDVLAPGAGRFEFEQSGLADRFALRGSDGVYVEFDGGVDSFASDLTLNDIGDRLPGDLRGLVASGRLGYAYTEVADEPFLIVGGQRPGGPDFYFFTAAADVEDALSRLQQFLIIAGVVVVALAALAAGLISRRLLRPVRTASTAAGVMAGGDLSVRLPADSDDEFGQWAESFNLMAASLEDKVAELQAAHDRERRFVADVSHELRTPLTALVAEADMAAQFLSAMPDDAARVGAMLRRDIDRLRHLVEDLLEISRLDAPTEPAGLDTFDLAPFLAAVIDDRLPHAQLTGGEARIRGDRRGLERIVGNLLDNADTHAPNAAVTVRAAVSDDRLTIVVADDGPGVPPENLERIFERFTTMDSARGGGSGLGLAIAREHARRMGGDLAAQANEPVGLAFELQIPVTVLLHGRDGREIHASDPEGDTPPATGRST